MLMLFSNIFNQDLCFFIRRKRLFISFHCCRICFQILFEETFSMLFSFSGCSCAENFCNLQAIFAILLIFLHKYLVFVKSSTSLIHIIVKKTSQCNISCSKIIRDRKQIAITSNCCAQRPMECSSDKE